jgi:hypothetical protein
MMHTLSEVQLVHTPGHAPPGGTGSGPHAPVLPVPAAPPDGAPPLDAPAEPPAPPVVLPPVETPPVELPPVAEPAAPPEPWRSSLLLSPQPAARKISTPMSRSRRMTP